MAPSIIKTVITFFESSKTPITYIVALTLGFKLFRWYVAGGVCVSKKRLDGKTVIITGCNTGIGLETAKELSARGARIVMACRDIDKAHKASEIVKKFSGNSDVSVELLDLASLDSVRKFAENVNNDEARIDILINNAGVMMCPKWRSDDGYEMQFAVNHLGHFLLTTLLLDRIKESAPSRIINISSFAHYGSSILGFILFRWYVAGGVCVSKKRLDGKTVIITGCNTGIGLETAKELSARGARIILACRDLDNAHKASEIVKKFSGNSDVSVERLDLASLDSVRKIAEKVKNDEAKIDILINNAGVMMCPKWQSEDGYEMQFAVNHLGHFFLTTLVIARPDKGICSVQDRQCVICCSQL